MAIFELFSRRRAAALGQVPDIYTYDSVPMPFRIQFVQIMREVIGLQGDYTENVDSLYEAINSILRKEFGCFQLPSAHNKHRNFVRFEEELSGFLLDCSNEQFFDAMEVITSVMDTACRKTGYQIMAQASTAAEEGINELNARLKQHALGYQFTSGYLIRMDEEIMHEEVVRPALALLQIKHFAGARGEFLKAHEHYRKGNKGEVLVECYKAFESIMKAICDKHGWAYDKSKAAAHLIDVCLQNKLIPEFWQSHFTGLRTVLESAIPTPRNKTSAHGVGTVPREAPDELVPYVLHMTAATLLFLGDAEARLA